MDDEQFYSGEEEAPTSTATAEAPAASEEKPNLAQLHDELVKQFTSDEFLTQHPRLPHPTKAEARGFNGDEGIKEIGPDVGEAYEKLMREAGASAEDAGGRRSEIEAVVKRRAKELALQSLANSQPRYQSEWESQALFGGIISRNHQKAVKNAEEAISEDRGDMNDYLQKAADLRRQQEDQERSGAAAFGHGALKAGQMISEFGMMGPLAKGLGAGGAGLSGALKTGAAYTAIQFPLTGAQDLMRGKPLGEVAKDETFQLFDNALFAGIAGIGAAKEMPAGLMNKGKALAWDALKLIAAGEVSQDAKAVIGEAEHPGELTRLGKAAITGDKKEAAAALTDMWQKQVPLLILNAAFHTLASGHKADPSALADQMTASELLQQEMKQRPKPPEPGVNGTPKPPEPPPKPPAGPPEQRFNPDLDAAFESPALKAKSGGKPRENPDLDDAFGMKPVDERPTPEPPKPQWKHTGTKFDGDKFSSPEGKRYSIGEKVYEKGHELYENGGVRVAVKDSAGKEVARAALERNKDGTFSGDIIADPEAPRGAGRALYDWVADKHGQVTPHTGGLLGQTAEGKAFWDRNQNPKPSLADRMRQRSAQQGDVQAPGQRLKPLRTQEPLMTDAEVKGEAEHFQATPKEKLPEDIRKRTEGVLEKMAAGRPEAKEMPEAMWNSVGEAHAIDGPGAAHELLALHEEALGMNDIPKTHEGIQQEIAATKHKLLITDQEYLDESAKLLRRGLNEASLRRRLGRGVQKATEHAKAATAPEEAHGSPGQGAAGVPEDAGRNGGAALRSEAASAGGSETDSDELKPPGPEHVKQLADELRERDKANIADHNHVVRKTWKMLKEHGVRPVDYKKKYEDASKVPGLDEAADHWATRRPDLFVKDGEEPSDILHAKLRGGMLEPMSAVEALRLAEEELTLHQPRQEDIDSVNRTLKKSGRAPLTGKDVSTAQRNQASERAQSALDAGDVAHESAGGDTSFDFGEAEPAAGKRTVGAPPVRPEPTDPIKEIAKDLIEEEGGAVPLDKAVERVKAGFRYVKEAIGRFGGKMFPAITGLDRASGEAVADMAGASTFAKIAGQHFGDKVLGHKSTQEFDRLVGAALLETRFRNAKRNGSAPNAGTLVGGQNSPLQTEADYRAAMRNPEVQAAFDGYEQHHVPEKEQMLRGSQGLDEHDPINSPTQLPGMPISALAMQPGDLRTDSTVRVGGGSGNLKNLKLSRNPRAMQATLSAGDYEVDLRRIIENDFSRGYPLAAKAKAYRTLEAAGVGQWERPGLQLEGSKEVPFTKPPAGTQAAEGNQVFYVKNEAYGEFRNALNVDQSPAYAKVASAISSLPTVAALASSVEAASHSVNLATALFTKPSGAWHGGLGDFFYNAYQRIMDAPAFRGRLLELARINAVKPPGSEFGKVLPEKLKSIDPTYYAGKVLDGLSDIMRMTLSDGFARMASKGMVENTATNKRDFINQSTGQYQKQAQNGLVRFFRDTGFGPFATAGTTFNTQGLKALGLGTNVAASNMRSALIMRGEVFAKVAAVLGAGMAYNYARWGRPDGDEKTPFLAIKVGEKDGKSVSIDLSPLVLVKRGLRATGVLGYIEAYRQGKPEGVAEDKGIMQAVRSLAHPFMGPAVQFTHTAITGNNFLGTPIADQAKKSQSQMLQNTKAALMNANPAISALTGADESPKQRKQGSASDPERLMKLAGPFGLQYRGAAKSSRGRR